MKFKLRSITNAVDVQPWSVLLESLSLLSSVGTRCFLIRFRSYFPELRPMTGNTLNKFLRASIKLLISSDCFRVFVFTSVIFRFGRTFPSLFLISQNIFIFL